MKVLLFWKMFSRWINRSIHRRLVFWSIGFWIISMLILAQTFLWVGSQEMIRQARERNIQLASVISRDVNAQVSAIYSDTRTFKRHLEALGPELNGQAESILSLRLASPQRYRAVYYLDSERVLLFHLTDTPDALIAIKDPESIVYRPGIALSGPVSEAVQKFNGTVTYTSDVYFSGIDRVPAISMVLPLNFTGSPSKILILELDLRDIWQRIDLSTLGTSGVTYAVSRLGTIIAHPKQEFVGRQIPEEIKPLLAGYEGFAVLPGTSEQASVLAAYSPVGGAEGWGIVVAQDESEAEAPVMSTGSLISSIWLALAVIGTIGIFLLLRGFTRPISDLTRNTDKIASTGFLSKTAAPPRDDEVGQLSRAFDQMIDRLRTTESERQKAQEALEISYSELELRVDQRTKDLQQTNARLVEEIAQRQAAEQKLAQSETRYRDLVENTDTIMLELDAGGNFLSMNRYAQEFFGYPESEVLGRNVVGIIVPEIDSAGNDLKIKMDDIWRNTENYATNENENIKRSGERVWVAWSNKGIYDHQGNLKEVHCTGIDRTQQKKAAEILAVQARENAAAAERTRLARELHDAVSQTLFSASLIAQVLPKIWENNRVEGKKRLEEIAQLTRGALAEMRTLLFELRPSALRDAEPSELLRHLADSVTGRARLPVSLDIEGTCELSPDVKIGLYRIAQESLNNVAKHSGATAAEVSLKCSDDKVELIVRDNGLGFDLAKVSPGSHGLNIMRERAREIGASLSINSDPGKGTEVIAIWQNINGEVNR